jgi:uncharacterized protein
MNDSHRLNLAAGRIRRRFLYALLAAGVAAWGGAFGQDADIGEPRFPGDPAAHKVVYQFNRGDEEYQKAVLFSVGAMLRKYQDNVHIVVVGIGPGLHILAKQPGRPVSQEIKERVASLMQYGVEFHACGNTMKSLKWVDADMIPGAKIVEVGASDLMELQEQGYAYISW